MIHHEAGRAGSWALLVHVGAGSPASPPRQEWQHRCLAEARDAGARHLAEGGSALDAVEAGVRVMEACGAFNAGVGAVRDAAGGVSLDAAIMSGAQRRAGAVAAIGPGPSPVALARLVMERTGHVLLVGGGAEDFARLQQCPSLPRQEPPGEGLADEAASRGTVGAIARDRHGVLAAATSTGGLSGKLPGRVGDSPLIGAGTWADGRIAVSATGDGECFIRCAFAHQLATLVAAGQPLELAAQRTLDEVAALHGEGGTLALGRDGRYAFSFLTAAMPRAFASATRRWTAITRGADAAGG